MEMGECKLDCISSGINALGILGSILRASVLVSDDCGGMCYSGTFL